MSCFGILQVRVISVPGIPMELCGGTHVSNNTAEIPRWKMISDQGIAAGVQCVQALAQRTVIEEVCAAQNESSSLRIELLSPTEETKPNIQHTRFIEDSQFGSHGFDTLLCYPGNM
jgi:alanyl-tRNA synthetase